MTSPHNGLDASTPLGLVDSHAHLQDEALACCLEAVLARSRAAGVRTWVCNGAREKDWPRVAEIAARQPGVIPCFGLHPWHIGSRSGQWLDRLAQWLETIPSAVGEIGLDRWIKPRDEAAQEEVFRAQLRLARERHLPVMIHCVRAWDWLLEVLRKEPPPAEGLLLHAYSGPVEIIESLVQWQARFSFAGTLLHDRNLRLRETLERIPRDRLLLETDSPDLLPPPDFRVVEPVLFQGKARNEPANLRAIQAGVAAWLKMDEAALARLLWRNHLAFLGSFQPGDPAARAA